MKNTPIRIASTTMLVRETCEMEVLMVKRNDEIDFFSGAMLFPGGKVEPQDYNERWADHAKGWHDIAEEERAPRIAALRETFEECGVLAAAGTLKLDPAETLETRAAVESGDLPFLDYVRSRQITVDLTELTLFSRWLTPPVVPKRFDTFFYLVTMPAGQTIAHDGRETIENEWVSPAEALQRATAGERRILFPTKMNLRHLAESTNITEAVAKAEARPRRQVVPTIDTRHGRKIVRLSQEDGYGYAEDELAT